MASKASSSASQTETLSSTSDQRVSLTLAFLKALGMDKHVPQIFDTSGIYCNLFGSFLKVNDIKRGRISCTIAIKLPFAASTNVNVHQDLKDVKLWQVHTLLKGLEKIVVSADIPMLVCGDFNSVPRSAPHALLAMGKVDPSHPDLTVDPLNILCPHSKLVHQLPLGFISILGQSLFILCKNSWSWI